MESANAAAYDSGIDTGIRRVHGAHRLPYEATPCAARPTCTDYIMATRNNRLRVKKRDDSAEEKEALAEEICSTLTIHVTVEEEIFYPAARENVEEQDLDDVVAWQACIQDGDADHTENIEVHGSHCGLGWNSEVLSTIADRLRQPMGAWQRHGRASSLEQAMLPTEGDAKWPTHG